MNSDINSVFILGEFTINPTEPIILFSRDWNPGEDIPSQIFRSVADSRKTIIVLNQNYVESKWSDMEFNAAHKKALEDKIQVDFSISSEQKLLDNKIFS